MKEIRVLVFTEGTILMHRGAADHRREEIVRQVKEREASVMDFGSYISIGGAVEKLRRWRSQGAKIEYLTSRVEPREVEAIERVLMSHGFPDGRLNFRRGGEGFGEVAEMVAPDVLIEDDCESIGGYEMMTIAGVKPEVRRGIRSVVVREFGGIDHLPDEVDELLSQ